MGPYQVLPLCARGNLGAIAMKGESIYFMSYLGHLTLCRDADGVFYSTSRPRYRTLVVQVLPLCRDSDGVFYRSSRLSYRTLVVQVVLLFRDAHGVF